MSKDYPENDAEYIELLERDLAAARKELAEARAKLAELCGVDNYLLATENDKLKAKLDRAVRCIEAYQYRRLEHSMICPVFTGDKPCTCGVAELRAESQAIVEGKQ